MGAEGCDKLCDNKRWEMGSVITHWPWGAQGGEAPSIMRPSVTLASVSKLSLGGCRQDQPHGDWQGS